jgi:hypothetical protein
MAEVSTNSETQSPTSGGSMKRKTIVFDDIPDDVVAIMWAAFGPYPYSLLDGEGRPWPTPARFMNRDEILLYIFERYGPAAANYIAASPALTLH